MASVGEPLNPEGVVWGNEVFGRPFHDNWWQTETGGIMIANYRSMDVQPARWASRCPGSRRRSWPRRGGDAVPARRAGRGGRAGAAARLALDDARLPRRGGALRASASSGGWYLSGDLAMRDEDGYFWFVGRADDLIKSSGHLIGPFEVESALMEHPAVAEAGVIGVPDETAGEVVKAFVALKPGFAPGEALEREHARPCPQAPGRRGGPARDRLPRQPAKTRSRQDHAAAAEGARAGPARGRHLDPGDATTK